MDENTMKFAAAFESLDRRSRFCIIACFYAIRNEPVTETEIERLRNALTAAEWQGFIKLLVEQREEMPSTAAAANKAIRFIQGSILQKAP